MLQLKVGTHGLITVAALTGEFDAAPQDDVVASLMALVSNPGSRLAVDLSGVRGVDSSGLSMLMNVVARGRLNDCRVVLVGPSPFVAGVLHMTKLDTWFEIHANLDLAEKAMPKSS